ncbi:NAD-dependent epimerase/dehydratase family protein [Neptuniibacter pectenicola]|jgi:nucleoside-diphosphate-sugar epimerase|uniref:NAD-dependent epimerase/dehydratase family protein n=1 Tax=Neptuniibacter pectenicola TaxID=1806669 RepID=UPI0030EB38BF|tara:strand:+ start:3133 stop:4062 length:930 start_codon:yes stop_codon:yes gene_type:complete
MKIAIFGGNSAIAQSLLSYFCEEFEWVYLFVRNVDPFISEDVNEKGFQYINASYHQYKDLVEVVDVDVLINCVGVGDPAKAKALGLDILKITECYDSLALNMVENTGCKYIFFSSGAIYNSSFNDPAKGEGAIEINLNEISSYGFYSLSKLLSEIKHRIYKERSIFDIRVFNYYSSCFDLKQRYFITDAVRAIKNKEVLVVDSNDIVRDYIAPKDLFQLIRKLCLPSIQANDFIDCYSKKPVRKFEILEMLRSEFGLKYTVDNSLETINATGMKINYFSISRKALKYGYEPEFSSLEAIRSEMKILLNS